MGRRGRNPKMAKKPSNKRLDKGSLKREGRTMFHGRNSGSHIRPRIGLGGGKKGGKGI